MKNNWEKEFDKKFGDLGKYNSNELGILNFEAKKLLAIKSFIESLLAEQKHDYEILVNTILEGHKKELAQQKKELLKAILKKAPKDFPEETNPELVHEVLAEIIGTKLENFNEGYNQCNQQWKEIIKNHE